MTNYPYIGAKYGKKNQGQEEAFNGHDEHKKIPHHLPQKPPKISPTRKGGRGQDARVFKAKKLDAFNLEFFPKCNPICDGI